jgi:hypothetical protein
MLRRIALTIVPCVAVFTAAVCLASSLAPRAEASLSRTLSPAATPTLQLAARSGYTVASS